MEFNKKKFNIMVVFTVCLIFLVVIFSALDLTGLTMPEEIVDTDADSGDVTGGENNNENEGQEEPKLDKVPTFTANQKWILLSYAFDKLNTYDYKVVWIQSVTSAGITQKIDKYLYCVGDQSYVKAISAGLPMASFTEFTYIDGKTRILKSRGGAEPTVWNYDAFYKRYGIDAKELPYIFNQSSCTVDKFINDPLKNYYELDITLNPVGYQKYLSVIQENGMGSIPEMVYDKMTIRIDKKYGTVTSMVIKEKYILRGSPLGDLDCDSSITVMFDYTYDSSWENGIKECKDALGLK